MEVPLFIASDLGRRSVWRVTKNGQPALGDVQIVGLAGKFGLNPRQVSELSDSLSRWLDPRQSPLFLGAGRSSVGSRGNRAFRAAVREIAKAQWKTLEALGGLEALQATHRPAELKRIVRQLNQAHKQLRDGGEALRRIANDEFLLIGPGDRGRGTHARRRLVLREIFSFWEGTGRKLTFTTDPSRPSVAGPSSSSSRR